jgi:predicted nucleic acid-binding Zn ribbon protein
MKHNKQSQARWQLERERFHLFDHRPPKPARKEREIGPILNDILKNEPTEEGIPNALKNRWHIITGAQIAKHTAPARLKGNTLYVHADHPGWLAEIRHLPQAVLLKKLTAIPEIPQITNIRFLLDPSIQTWRNRT